MAVFALTMNHGPGWDPARGTREQQAWGEQASFMDGLVYDGFVILGGPLGDGEHVLPPTASAAPAGRSAGAG